MGSVGSPSQPTQRVVELRVRAKIIQQPNISKQLFFFWIPYNYERRCKVFLTILNWEKFKFFIYFFGHRNLKIFLNSYLSFLRVFPVKIVCFACSVNNKGHTFPQFHLCNKRHTMIPHWPLLLPHLSFQLPLQESLWRRTMASAEARFSTGIAPIMEMQLSTAIKLNLNIYMVVLWQ